MTQATTAPSVSESEVPTDQRRPKKSLGGFRLSLKKNYLLLVAVILLTVIPIISWVAWHELNLPGNPFAVLPPETPLPDPAVPPTAPPEPLPVIPAPAPAPDAVPAVATSPPPPDDARLVRLEELMERNTVLLEQIERALQVNEDAHLYMSEKIDQIEDVKATSETLSAMVYDISMQVDALSPYSSDTPAVAAGPTVQSSPAAPPFELLAIDKWQHDWYAVLELDGQVAMVTPPESRAGWELVRLDPTARKAVFRNTASGTEHELQVR